MSFIEGEIASQPAAWRQAAELAATADVSSTLPESGARVAVVGCGTSLYMSQAFAALRESNGHGETDAFAASEFPSTRSYDHVVAITRSGTTTEVLRLLGNLPKSQRSTVITTSKSLPVGALARQTVALDFADEQSVVQTRFATAALALWRGHLGEDLSAAIADAEAELVRELPEGIVDRRQITYLGTGWTVGLANEAALKVREAAQAWAEAYPAMEFRHGPISIIDDRSAVWIFGTPPDGLVDEVTRAGALVVTSDIDPMAHLIGAQRYAVAVAQSRGLNPDVPRNLTRSIILASA